MTDIPLDHSLCRILTVYLQVASNRSQSQVQPKAKYILKCIQAKNFMLFCHFLEDVLAVLVKFSMVLQARTASLYQVHQSMEATVLNLQKMQTGYV